MIDEKKIEKAASQYATAQFSNYDIHASTAGFKAGINWFLKNLWHDADKEEPKPSPKDIYGFLRAEDIIWLLAITKDNEVKMMWSTHEEKYEGDEDGYWLFHDMEGDDYNPFYGEVTKWLYIDDLMKGGNNG